MTALCNRKILFGIGIGILIGVFFTMSYKLEATFSDDKVEQRARELGMKYPEEIKVMEKEREAR